MFKKIFLDGEETRWSVNENGQVRNDENGKFLKGTILHTYRYINFRWNKKQKNKISKMFNENVQKNRLLIIVSFILF